MHKRFKCIQAKYSSPSLFAALEPFSRFQLLGGLRVFLKVFRKLFERCLQLEDGQESCLAFLDTLLRHETTLSWYLREEAEDPRASGAMLDYSSFLLDMTTLILLVGIFQFLV